MYLGECFNHTFKGIYYEQSIIKTLKIVLKNCVYHDAG
jgi:hypothetical protein